ncbi:MAG: hypothetical protein QM778_32955 [Myxococcales bacterium]
MSIELDDETLQRFYDGDLSPVEERAVQSRIAQDPSAQKRLRELERLSALFKIAAEDAASGLDSDAMFANIEQQIRTDDAQGTGARLRVVAGEWASSQRRLLLPLAAVAAAAAVAIFALNPSGSDDETARSAQKRERTRVAELGPNEEAPSAPSLHGTRVENVDFGNSTGTVFEIDSEGVATAVVWIADDEEEEPQ